MTVLFLQSPYSHLFRDIAKELREKNVEVLALTFNPGDRMLYKGITQLDAHKLILEQLKNENLELKLMPPFTVRNYFTEKVKKLHKRNLDVEESRYFWAYAKVLEKLIDARNIRSIIMQNDTRWQHDLAKSVANRLGVKCLFFELGLFRPNTITIDCNGVNYNNSVPRDKEFYNDPKYDLFPESENIKISPINRIKRDLIVAKYILLNEVGRLLKINSIPNKDLHLSEYFSRFIKSYIVKEKAQQVILPNRYIFVPFQVNDDSQILVHSDFNNMTECIETVINQLSKYNRRYSDNVSIVFKEHPMDIGKSNYEDIYLKYRNRNDLIFLKFGNVNELIKNSVAVITINSTVGLEALESFKPVICLGRAFYAIEGIATHVNKNRLCYAIKTSLNTTVNKCQVGRFINYLKHYYQFRGDEYFYDNQVVKRIVDYVIQIIESRGKNSGKGDDYSSFNEKSRSYNRHLQSM